MSAYVEKLRLEKKTELSRKVSLSLVDDIWEKSLALDDAEEFIDYLMTIADQEAIEEFFNKCHDQGGKFCGGGTSSKGGIGPNRGPGTHIPAPIDYFKTTIKSAWKVRQQRQKSQKLKAVTGPLLGITGPYGVRVGRLEKTDLSKFSERDLGTIKTRLESNQRKFNKFHTTTLANLGLTAAALGAMAATAPAGSVVVTLNPVGAASVAYVYGLSRWKTKHIPVQIRRVNRELTRRKGAKVAASIEDLTAFQGDDGEDNLPTLEQEIAAAKKELESLKPQKFSKPSQSDINNLLDLLAAAAIDEDMPEAGKAAIDKMMA
jgi:hypothetical protein